MQLLHSLPENDGALIRRDELPAYLPISKQTAARWKHEGRGPKCFRVGRRVVYRVGDLREWLRAQQVN